MTFETLITLCVYLCICGCKCMCVKCGSMPIRAIAVYVPKEESRLSLSVRRKKIDTRKPIASRHYTNLHLHLEYTYYLIYNIQCIYIVYIIYYIYTIYTICIYTIYIQYIYNVYTMYIQYI